MKAYAPSIIMVLESVDGVVVEWSSVQPTHFAFWLVSLMQVIANAIAACKAVPDRVFVMRIQVIVVVHVFPVLILAEWENHV